MSGPQLLFLKLGSGARPNTDMTHDDHNMSGATPAETRAGESSEGVSESGAVPVSSMPSLDLQPHNHGNIPPSQKIRFGISDDLRVPWGWHELLLFVILGLLGSISVTYGLAEIAVRVFHINSNDVFGAAITTAKSVVVLVSQAVVDAGAIGYLYLMVLGRTRAPFWQTIGWRGLGAEPGKFRVTALHFLAWGAVLALVVTFAGAFLNSKENLPIDELLKARVSIFLFAVLGVVVAPLVEETIFRGFLYPVIARRAGVTLGIAITGTLFGLMHAVQLWGGWGQIALLIFVGVVLTWVRARTGTVMSSYFVHLGYNGLQLFGYVFYIIGGMHR
jgi:membrane protease YdiL (CAAX protease family)